MSQDKQKPDKWVLFSADTDKIKEYVFETAKLPEIRGASMILDDLNHKQARRLVEQRGGTVIYAGGGSLLALVSEDQVQELKQEIEQLYPQQTDVATITCVSRPLTDRERNDGLGGYTFESLCALREKLTAGEWQRIADYYHEPEEHGDAITPEQFKRRKNFGEMVTLQGILLRRAKESKSIAPFVEAVPFARRCAACGNRPAVRYEPSPESRYLCSACARKFGSDKRWERKSIWQQRFTSCAAEQGVQVIAVPPSDLEEIGRAALDRAKNYVGFIYADGNEVGKAVERAQSIEQYKRNSAALEDTTRRVTYQALLNHLRQGETPEKPTPVRAFEIISIGGDDLLLIVPADAALSIARDICRGFEQQLQHKGFVSRKPPTMSAGVIIADSHTPIYFLRDLAEQLLKNAKKRAHKLEPPQGTIDFLVLKSQSTLATDLSHLRSMPPLLLTERERKEKLFLTGRPYTLTELDQLIEAVHTLRDFPRSQLQSYRRALQGGHLRATLYFLYQYARAKEPERSLLDAIFQTWRAIGNRDRSPWLFKERQGGYTCYWTPWADILEIMDFVPRRAGGQEGGNEREGSD